MTGCEILVVLTLLRAPDGTASAIKATPQIPRKCKARVRFRAAAPVRLILCPVPMRD